MSMHHLPVAELTDKGADSDAPPTSSQKRAHGVTADGTMWIYHLVQFAHMLLSQPKHTESWQPFSAEQRQAWDRWGSCMHRFQKPHTDRLVNTFNNFWSIHSMMESVANLKKKSKKGATAENTAFQQLFLLVGMHLFKVRTKGTTNKMSDNA